MNIHTEKTFDKFNEIADFLIEGKEVPNSLNLEYYNLCLLEKLWFIDEFKEINYPKEFQIDASYISKNLIKFMIKNIFEKHCLV